MTVRQLLSELLKDSIALDPGLMGSLVRPDIDLEAEVVVSTRDPHAVAHVSTLILPCRAVKKGTFVSRPGDWVEIVGTDVWGQYQPSEESVDTLQIPRRHEL